MSAITLMTASFVYHYPCILRWQINPSLLPDRVLFMNRIICFVACLLIALMCCACSSGKKFAEGETGPEKAYFDFVQELRACGQDNNNKNAAGTECDVNKIWDALDVQSKNQFVDAYAALVKIDRIIETYFDPIEHQYMRAKTGTDVLKKAPINNYKDLFAYIFKPDKLVFNDNTESGLEIEQSVKQDDYHVTIKTHIKQEVPMVFESDGVWRVAGLIDYINFALAPIFASVTAMQEYAKGNLEAEIKRRTTVRSYFLAQVKARRELGIIP